MGSRIYEIEKGKETEFFRRKAGGTLYFFHKEQEVCLETNDFSVAKANKDFHIALVGTYGPVAFKATYGKLLPFHIAELRKKVKEGHLRKSYVDSIEWCWNKYLTPFWSKKKLIDYHQTNWTKYCQFIKSKFEVSAFKNHRITITTLMKWAQKNRFILAVPELDNPPHKKRQRKIISSEHLKLIFQFAPTVNDWRFSIKDRKPSRRKKKASEIKRVVVPGGLRLFMACYLFQGMRRSEIVKLKWGSLDFQRKSLLLTDDDVKTKMGREIPLNNSVIALLTERIQVLDELNLKTKYVFPNARDPKRFMSLSGFKTTWANTIGKANLKDCGYTWHDFRATFELHMDRAKHFTDTQKEKMAGASMTVQRRDYISMNADDLRGLEDAVNMPELLEQRPKRTEG